MTDKFTPFDHEHRAILMRTPAKFHARSFIIERQYEKSLHDEFAHCMQETPWPRVTIRSGENDIRRCREERLLDDRSAVRAERQSAGSKNCARVRGINCRHRRSTRTCCATAICGRIIYRSNTATTGNPLNAASSIFS